MHGFYCEACDSVIVKAGHPNIEIPTHHQHRNGEWYLIYYMGYFHPDFKVCEIEGEIRQRIETFGLIGEETYV
jgi:hypothetical protein